MRGGGRSRIAADAQAVLLWLMLLPALAHADGTAVVAAARAQVGVTTGYDGSYRRLAFPGGDVPIGTGVCSDVVIRALRTARGIDLQREVNADMRRDFAAYPREWGLSRPDRNIDHRRVPNLETWFARNAIALPLSTEASQFRPGDVVSWRLDSGLPHIGIVSDRARDGRPLVIHNIGRGAQEEDVLFAWRMVGHYRLAGD